ncbi:hypothetical protein E2C01_006309 [Portunus trituberculatus]|uniref:Uncharacterized protein n=1 Tax=Portunus trituberculatus TaxID=210409 RepID=A0A5B7CXK0_PORTR|nr:hypothetical protein [Portunus trituberculatus]
MLFELLPVVEVVGTFNPAGERSLQGLYFHVSYFVRRPELAAIFHTGQHQRLPKLRLLRQRMNTLARYPAGLVSTSEHRVNTNVSWTFTFCGTKQEIQN